MPSSEKILLAYRFRAALLRSDLVRRDGYLLVRGGRVEDVVRRAPAHARVVEPPGDVIVPGLVNAHVHLAFDSYRSLPNAPRRFAPWIESLLAAPPPAPAAIEARARAVAVSGTALVGEHDGGSTGAAVLRAARLGGVVFREFFAFAEEPARALVRRVAKPRALAPRDEAPIVHGVAPHAPFTVRLDAARALARLKAPISVHLAETEEETAWTVGGTGPLETLLLRRGRRPEFPVPGVRPVEWLRRTGLLRPRTLAVHANCINLREARELAAGGVVAVHCPGTHRYFRRGDTPLRIWSRARLPFAIGTDSAASNDSLDLFRELARLHRTDPWLSPREIVAAALERGAAALGFPQYGALVPGSAASMIVLRGRVTASGSSSALLRRVQETLLAEPAVAAMFNASHGSSVRSLAGDEA